MPDGMSTENSDPYAQFHIGEAAKSVGGEMHQVEQPVAKASLPASEMQIPESVKSLQSLGPNKVDMANVGMEAKMRFDPGADIAQAIERERVFFRQAEQSVEAIEATTLPWTVRMETRRSIEKFILAPVGLGDNYGFTILHGELGNKADKMDKVMMEEDAKDALGFDIEPWREPKIITDQQILQYAQKLMIKNPEMTNDQWEKTKNDILAGAKERLPFLANELRRSQDELATTRKVVILYWIMRQAASGKQVGDIYLETQLPSLPTPYNFAEMLSVPAHFVTSEEIEKWGTKDEKGDKKLTGYPAEGKIQALLSAEKREGNEKLGLNTERSLRLDKLIAMSDDPERVMRWKFNAERAALNKILIEKEVNEAYLDLKKKGIRYLDPAIESQISTEISKLTSEEIIKIKNSFWQQFGFSDEVSGQALIGNPERWIPEKARRGDPKVDESEVYETYSNKDFDWNKKVEEISKLTLALEKDWKALSPLENPSFADQEIIRLDIKTITTKLREASTIKDKDGHLVTVVPTLPLENELGLRKKATEFGAFWSRPQMAKDKKEIMEKTLKDFAKGDTLAFEESQALAHVFGIKSKYAGAYKRDYDPTLAGDKWMVDVEAFPYTDEFSVLMRFPDWQIYKREAGGPPASRGKFGPLMTDYLNAYNVTEVDQYGKPIFIIMDKDGVVRKGRANDGGIILADTNYTIDQKWEEGESLSDTKLWDFAIEDPFRRFLLRGFFAEGRSGALGDMDIVEAWKRNDWSLDDLQKASMWDKYKLARKVAVLREELFEEPGWKEVVASIDEEYKKEMGQTAVDAKQITDRNQRMDLLKEKAGMYGKWKGERKQKVSDYSDEVFGDGLISSTGCINWQLEEIDSESVSNFQGKLPSNRLIEVASLALSRGVYIFGKDRNSTKKRDLPLIAIKAWNEYFRDKQFKKS